MEKKILSIVCTLLLLSCSTRTGKECDIPDNRIQYVNYLNDYWSSGVEASIDSALKYNMRILETDSAVIMDYLYRIQMLYLCGQYDSILSLVNAIPQEMASWPPEYKSYLKLKCKAVEANEVGDVLLYRSCLDSIIKLWDPLVIDYIAVADSLFSMPIDVVLNKHGRLCILYAYYYEIFSLLQGKDSTDKILSAKKEKYNWHNTTYTILRDYVNSDDELSLP